ncbi:hypothetical protein [Synechococcus sp. ROS8604]|uniref:hypothetical protein n=1 Tax=Synechococcus sp. ROS8604 TaxID=1442557 RepID=UPI00164744EB|nr:hypothetical protein [Synechococcus sp. ROS8604]
MTFTSLIFANDYFRLENVFIDLLALFIAPSINFFLVDNGYKLLDQRLVIKILQLIIIFGLANAAMSIVQSLLGPTHFLNLGVSGDFDGHTTMGGIAGKARGIFSVANGSFQAIAILTANYIKKTRQYSYYLIRFPERMMNTLIILSLASAVLNLTSRSYSLYVLIAVVLPYINIKNVRKLFSLKSLLISTLVALLIFIFSPNFLSSIASLDSFSGGIHRITTAEAPPVRILMRWGVISDTYPLNFSYSVFPRVGIGSTINNQDIRDSVVFSTYCPAFIREFEPTRILCSLGWFNGLLVLIFFKLGIGLHFFFKGIRLTLKNNDGLSIIGYLLISNSILYLLAFPFRINNSQSMLVVFGIALSCLIYSSKQAYITDST